MPYVSNSYGTHGYVQKGGVIPMDIFHKSLKELGAKRIFGFNTDDKTAAIWNVQFADKSICTFIYYYATKEWRIVD